MEKSLMTLDPKEYGIQESKAKELELVFLPMIEKMKELEVEYNAIVNKPLDKDLCKDAKELRMKYVKVRTGTATIHKEAKAFYLAGCKYVDGWKNAQLFASQGIEAKLEEIETHYAKLEAEAKQKLHEERLAEYTKYSTNVTSLNFADMTDEIYNTFIAGAKANHEAKIEAERQAELHRLELEKQERKRQLEIQEQMRKEQEEARLRQEAEEKARKEKERLEAEQKEKERIEKEKRDAEEKERLRIENKKREEELQEKIRQEMIEKERIKEQLRVQREEAEKKANEEKAQREKLEAELKAKQAEEAKRIEAQQKELAKKKAEEKRLKNAPDKDKIQTYIARVNCLNFPEIESEEAKTVAVHLINNMNKLFADVQEMINKL